VIPRLCLVGWQRLGSRVDGEGQCGWEVELRVTPSAIRTVCHRLREGQWHCWINTASSLPEIVTRRKAPSILEQADSVRPCSLVTLLKSNGQGSG